MPWFNDEQTKEIKILNVFFWLTWLLSSSNATWSILLFISLIHLSTLYFLNKQNWFNLIMIISIFFIKQYQQESCNIQVPCNMTIRSKECILMISFTLNYNPGILFPASIGTITTSLCQNNLYDSLHAIEKTRMCW